MKSDPDMATQDETIMASTVAVRRRLEITTAASAFDFLLLFARYRYE
jgi:hypothetical protein